MESLKAAPDIPVSELITFILDLRSVIYTSYKEDELKAFQSLFPDTYIEKGSKEMCGEAGEVALISKSHDSAIKASRSLRDSRCLGALLGYPDCCIEKHLTNIIADPPVRGAQTIFDSFVSRSTALFLTNNLLNFATRLDSKEDLEQNSFYHQKNNFYLNQFFYLDSDVNPCLIWFAAISFISHLPCRYDCEKSVKIGRKVAKWMKENIPEVFVFFKNTLQRPFLVFDTFDWIAFEGNVENGFLRYFKIVPPLGVIDSQIKQNLNLGNRLKADKDKIVIFKDDRPVFEYIKKDEKDGYLMNFVDCEI